MRLKTTLTRHGERVDMLASLWHQRGEPSETMAMLRGIAQSFHTYGPAWAPRLFLESCAPPSRPTWPQILCSPIGGGGGARVCNTAHLFAP